MRVALCAEYDILCKANDPRSTGWVAGPKASHTDEGNSPLPTLVSADLLSPEAHSYRGCLDGFEPESGLLGWALNLQDPAERLTLRFHVDGMVVSEVVTSHPRPDLHAAVGAKDLQPGFCIAASELGRLLHLLTLRPLADFSIEIGSTSLFLPRIETVPTLQAMVSSSADGRRPRLPEMASLERLLQTRRDAEELTFLPLRPFEETRIGFIEAISSDEESPNLTWVIGWAIGNDLDDLPVVVVDGRKFSGAIMACRYPRQDLPIGAMGFVGVIHAEWRLRHTSQPIVYVGTSARRHLVSVTALPKVSRGDILHHLERHRIPDRGAKWSDLYALLTSRDRWSVRSAEHTDVRVGIDQMIVISRSGFLVSGWVLSFAKAIEGYALKVGVTAIAMDASSLVNRPRPDLLTAFPSAMGLTERAGFVCFFPGFPESTNFEPILLKIFLDHGPATVHTIEATHIRWLGETAPLDSLIQFYPNLGSESFFNRLALDIRREHANRSSSIEFIEFQKCEKALVIALPSSRDDAFLTLEETYHKSSFFLDASVGLVFLVNKNQRHGELIQQLQHFRVSCQKPVSIAVVPDTVAALYVLRDVLLAGATEQFCFLAANDILTHEGWRAVASFFEKKAARTIAFESVDPESLLRSPIGCLSFGSDWKTFSMSSSRIRIEIDAQPSPLEFLGDTLQDCGEIVRAGAFFTKKMIPGAVARLINLVREETDHASIL